MSYSAQIRPLLLGKPIFESQGALVCNKHSASNYPADTIRASLSFPVKTLPLTFLQFYT